MIEFFTNTAFALLMVFILQWVNIFLNIVLLVFLLFVRDNSDN